MDRIITIDNQQLVDERTIWSSKQNHPELVVQDCVREFDLTEQEAGKLRFILMNRGINKWLFARRKFIKLKHEVKEMMKAPELRTEQLKLLQYINERMQNIARMPRWVVWGTHVHSDRKKDERYIVISGRHC